MQQDYAPNPNRNCRNGWSKTGLIVLVLFSSASEAFAQDSSPSGDPSTLVLNERTLLYLAGLLLAHAAVPLVRYIWQVKTNKKSYRAFLASNIESAKKRFGNCLDTQFVRKDLPKYEGYDDTWLQMLEEKGVGAPELVSMMASTVAKRLDGEEKHERYVPYISYAGMPTAELNHEHPIWLFSKKENAIISKFLISELQVERSVQDLYSKPLIDLATSVSRQDRKRWTDAAFGLVAELSEHYLDLLRLERHLLGTKFWYRFIRGKTKQAHKSLAEMLDLD